RAAGHAGRVKSSGTMTTKLILCEAIIVLLLAGALPGCSISPERQESLRRAWAEGEARQAQDCQRRGLAYTAGVCAGGGGGPARGPASRGARGSRARLLWYVRPRLYTCSLPSTGPDGRKGRGEPA